MNFEDQAQLLLQSLQKTISEAEQQMPQGHIVDLDSTLGYELCLPLVIKLLETAYSAGKNGDKSSVVDITSVTANIYGCEPCPNCKSRFRYIANDEMNMIQCDDCGVKEKVSKRKKI